MPGTLAVIDFMALLGLLVLGQQIIAALYKITPPKDVQQLQNERHLRVLSLLIASIGFWLQFSYVPMALFLAGLGVSVAGLVMALWAQIVLGRNWVPGVGLYRNHKLVTSGPYRKIRHPLYTGMAMVFLGGAIMCANPVLIFAAITMFLSLLIRLPLEEAALKKRFGKRWSQYEKSTGVFLPRLRRKPR